MEKSTILLEDTKVFPDSTASEHPSLSESKSKRFGTPSLSVSLSSQIRTASPTVSAMFSNVLGLECPVITS